MSKGDRNRKHRAEQEMFAALAEDKDLQHASTYALAEHEALQRVGARLLSRDLARAGRLDLAAKVDQLEAERRKLNRVSQSSFVCL